MKWFQPSEYRCHCGRPDCEAPTEPHPDMQHALDTLRDRLGRPVYLTSLCRCAVWNAKWGGMEKSYHLTGESVDVACEDGAQRWYLVQTAQLFDSGFYLVEVCDKHVHLETRYRPNPILIVGLG